MATIKQLLDGRELPVKIFTTDLSHKWFEVTHKNQGACLGVNDSGVHSSWTLSSANWELYVEPKKTITVHEYLYESRKGNSYYVEWHDSDDQLKKNNPKKPIIKTGRSHTLEVDSEHI